MDVRITDCCALFYNATGIPVSCFDPDGQMEVTYPFLPTSFWNIFPKGGGQRNPDLYITESQGMYGRVLLPDGCSVVLGPAYSVPASEDILRAYMREAFIPFDQEDAARALLYAASGISYIRFLQNICFLHYCLTGEFVDPAGHFGLNDAERAFDLRSRQTRSIMEARENREATSHNSYLFEQKLFAMIRAGDVDRLHSFLAENGTTNIYPGSLADSPLRQAKDLFIVTVTKVVQLAAIPGKLDLELAYQLQDSYIQECEKCLTLAEVERLEFLMVTDFCRRLGTSRAPEGISQEIYQCMSFIHEHTNEELAVTDVADFIGRSPSYLLARFKKEVGVSVGAYIAQCKLEDAAHLLIYSDNSLSAISNYLCFSSQSYFQNVFKKQYGVTPLQYRKEHRK